LDRPSPKGQFHCTNREWKVRRCARRAEPSKNGSIENGWIKWIDRIPSMVAKRSVEQSNTTARKKGRMRQ
jgi:hypothetical protein